MGEFIGLLVIVFGPIIAAVVNYQRLRTPEKMMLRASGGARRPCRWIVRWDRRAAAEWARGVLSAPERRVLGGLQMSGPEKHDEPIELCIAELDGTVIYRSLIQPRQADIAPKSTELHGIADDEVAAAPTLEEVLDAARGAIGDREILFHNTRFVGEELEKACRRARIECPPIASDDLLLWHALSVAEWAPYEGRYEIFPLDLPRPVRACDYCTAAAALLREMAAEGEGETAPAA